MGTFSLFDVTMSGAVHPIALAIVLPVGFPCACRNFLCCIIKVLRFELNPTEGVSWGEFVKFVTYNNFGVLSRFRFSYTKLGVVGVI